MSQVSERPSLQMSGSWAETWPIALGMSSCARHVLKKPWQADPTLENLFETAIWHKTSVVQLIDHSDVFRQCFKSYSAQVCNRSGTPHASNLSSASTSLSLAANLWADSL